MDDHYTKAREMLRRAFNGELTFVADEIAALLAREAQMRKALETARTALRKTQSAWGGTCAWHADVREAIAALDAALAPIAAEPAQPLPGDDRKVCGYPDCNCPFDAPADPNWCARGLPRAQPAPVAQPVQTLCGYPSCDCERAPPAPPCQRGLPEPGVAREAVPVSRDDWQQKCLDMGFKYWRAPDAHGVTCTHQQATDLLARLLGVEVEVAAPGETCRACHGSGEAIGMTSGMGPDDHDVSVQCGKCGGTGELSAEAARDAAQTAAYAEGRKDQREEDESALASARTDARREARKELIERIDQTAAHMLKNAEALRKFRGHEQEARARELASSYVGEWANTLRLEDEAIRALPDAKGAK